MKKLLTSLDTIIRWVEDIVCGTTLAAIVCIATASVIARYIFHTGFLWADEVNQALLVAMGMFGSARAVRTNGHTEFTMLVNKPKSKGARIALRGAFLVITIVFLMLLLIWTAQYTADGTMLSTALRIPRMYYYMSIPMGFGLMIYEYLCSIKSRVIDDPVSVEE
ncbi:MAG: TRAP transporter small permease [Butyricicoccus pullicaecorum]|nr:TRAP transporter small permease [Butyricicoccus pullicaecorum]